ncbi:DGQHR domain-containing protein [Mucilaginibacter jinjuensis]|uniref:DGQHR domain-containing protein n=1 Tax=Mucilaginibacter jinjuensis TaxID=1176721 RepID=A0ABY7TBN4_9SPHI|nr:DGQHR domain-containing protein [Mucilaginibacter jinjuensis]WCT13480.1 DGQHR domain-containing protein [Mucilaginibacter jinjuensis]
MSFLKINAIKITQPLGDFFITGLNAASLRIIAFSEELQYYDESGKLQGSQRKIDDRRLKEIGRYIDSVELSFPNSIILAVNYNEEGELIENSNDRWYYNQIEGNHYEIIVPTDKKLAAIIDGQHRLKGFDYITDNTRLQVELPCSIFFDLPNSYQAYLFATINGNQKKVDKSLALEQFGFNVEDEPQHSWTPEKLAVYFVRQLNFKDSPLKGHIRIAPKMSQDLQKEIFTEQSQWMVSTATVVDGILNLISSKPKRDRVEMAQENIWGKRSRSMVEKFKSDKSPLRQLYLDKSDDEIFKKVFDFLVVAKKTVWNKFDSKSYIFKTVGVQALFDFLKRILEVNPNADESTFRRYFTNIDQYDFSKNTIQASGIGRKNIRDALLYSAGLLEVTKLSVDTLDKIKSLKS